MGTDIHWIAERLHSDGTWEASFSKLSCMQISGDKWYFNEGYLSSPQYSFGERYYKRFALMSGLRGEPNPETGRIAINGFPDDVSSHVRLSFGAETAYLHSLGWFTPQMLQEAFDTIATSANAKIKYEEDIQVLREWMKTIDQMIADQGVYKVNPDNILFGRERHFELGKDTEIYPDMNAESNHSKLIRLERIKGLLPMSEDTLRFCIAYDS